ncbi:response regulator transcription factor [Phycisphaeraceae bacterium D3-23]
MARARARKPGQSDAPPELRVFLVDDHPVICLGITQLLNEQPGMRVCGQANDTATARREILKQKPDVAVIDIALGEGNGLELLKELQAQGSKTAVLIVSSFDETVYAQRCLAAGASGYLNKANAPDQIVDAITQVAAGGIALSQAMAQRALKQSARGQRKTTNNISPIDSLTDRELQVLELLGNGHTSQEIADKLFVSPKTVETHRTHLKEKLGVASVPELVSYAAKWVVHQA